MKIRPILYLPITAIIYGIATAAIVSYKNSKASTIYENRKFSQIVIDLDGNGIETLNQASAEVYFDYDSSLMAKSTGWVTPSDGLLVLDNNSNSLIDNGTELIANRLHLPDTSDMQNAYQVLSEYDSNQDGVIDHQDDIWPRLGIWQDKNSDGITDPGELQPIGETIIAAISTQYKEINSEDKQGNLHRQTSAVTYQDGSQGISSNIRFLTRYIRSEYRGDIIVPQEIRQMPMVYGSGNLPNLHIAMAQNSQLKLLVEKFIASPQDAIKSGLIEQIVFSWAGVENIPVDSRGKYIDARILHFYETRYAYQYFDAYNNITNPSENSDVDVYVNHYHRFAEHTNAWLLSQTLYAEDFQLLKYNKKQNKYNFDGFVKELNDVYNQDIEKYYRLRNLIYGYFIDWPQYAEEHKQIGFASTRMFIGTEGNDQLRGNHQGVFLSGGAGDDQLFGGEGRDTLTGGSGNDYLNGGKGSDTYFFYAGNGQDTIDEQEVDKQDINTLRFGSGIGPDNISVVRLADATNAGDKLVLSLKDSSDSVTILNYFEPAADNQYRLELITFTDGSQWSATDVQQRLGTL